MSFLSAKDCFVAQTRDLLAPEPVLDCLTNIAVGCLLRYRAVFILMCLVQAVLFFKKPRNFIIILVKPVSEGFSPPLGGWDG